MNILLYTPDNGVTRNFMPHLWMFVLQALTPPGHKVFLIDANAQPFSEEEVARFVKDNEIELAGVGTMTRRASAAYKIADAIRGAGAKVVMGGPHVTELPDEPLGRDGQPRHADAVALGEADETWPRIVADAARGELEEVYIASDVDGRDVKPSLEDYPAIPWESMDLEQFNLLSRVPSWADVVLKRAGIMPWDSMYIIPIETGRGCPYGCDFCTVTGFFGESIRFRTNDSVVDEMLRLKERAKRENGQIFAFFVDDNFAINIKRAKSLMRDIIARDAVMPWVAQISVNLLRDQELLDLISDSGGKFIFIGLESIDAQALKDVHKGFNKPDEYGPIIKRLSDRGVYTITSFIFGMDGDQPGVADRTIAAIRSWPPGLPVFSVLTPYPSTPLYDRLMEEGRMTRPKHWLDFKPFKMAFTPKDMDVDEVEGEIHAAWRRSYDSEAIAIAYESIEHRPFSERAVMFFSRLAFRGIYFPQRNVRDWLGLLFENRRILLKLLRQGWVAHRNSKGNPPTKPKSEEPAVEVTHSTSGD